MLMAIGHISCLQMHQLHMSFYHVGVNLFPRKFLEGFTGRFMMKKNGKNLIFFLLILSFILGICIPVSAIAQTAIILPPVPVPPPGTSWVSATLSYLPVTLPTFALTPWGATTGSGSFGTTSYTIYNALPATALGGFIPFAPLPFYPPMPAYSPFPAFRPLYPSPAFVPPSPYLRFGAATTTVALALPSPVVAPAPLPVAPVPIISTTQLFLSLLLRIGEESGLFYTNPALFWYIIGLLY